MKVAGFDWGEGNWPKCGKHGVSLEEIESIFRNDPFTMRDPFPCEARWRAVGQLDNDHYVFKVFTLRHKNEELYIRPISARYMRAKEIKQYERTV